MGDTYSGGGSHSKLGGVETWGKQDGMKEGFPDTSPQASITDVIPAKSMIGIPWRLAIGLIDDNRNDVYELRDDLTPQERANLLDMLLKNKFLQNQENSDNYPVQEPRQTERILPDLREEMENRTQRTIQKKNGRMEEKESREDQEVQREILLDAPRTGDLKEDKRQCETAPQTQIRGSDSLWKQSADMCMLSRNKTSLLNYRSCEREWHPAQEGNKEIRLNLRMAETCKLSRRLQSALHELQFCNREVRNLSSRRNRVTLRKADIPAYLLQYFQLIKPQRWILRNAIVWHKPNSMPASVKDRLSNTYEHVFHFVKSRKYYYNLDAIRVPHKFAAKPFNIRVRDAQKGRLKQKWGVLAHASEREAKAYDEKNYPKYPPHEPRHFQLLSMGIAHGGHTGKTVRHDHPLGKNPGDLWKINSKPHPFAHFAVYPEEICVRPILSSCPEKVCTKCGMPQLPTVKKCECGQGFRPGIVLDMFAGSGTTLVVAKKLGRDFVGIELNPEYVKIAQSRLASISRVSASSSV
jgi:DNA modification methylase